MDRSLGRICILILIICLEEHNLVASFQVRQIEKCVSQISDSSFIINVAVSYIAEEGETLFVDQSRMDQVRSHESNELGSTIIKSMVLETWEENWTRMDRSIQSVYTMQFSNVSQPEDGSSIDISFPMILQNENKNANDNIHIQEDLNFNGETFFDRRILRLKGPEWLHTPGELSSFSEGGSKSYIWQFFSGTTKEPVYLVYLRHVESIGVVNTYYQGGDDEIPNTQIDVEYTKSDGGWTTTLTVYLSDMSKEIHQGYLTVQFMGETDAYDNPSSINPYLNFIQENFITLMPEGEDSFFQPGELNVSLTTIAKDGWVGIGDDMVVSCHGMGAGLNSMNLYMNGKLLTEELAEKLGGKLKIKNFGEEIQATFRLRGFTMDLAGEYICEVMNGEGQVKTSTITLKTLIHLENMNFTVYDWTKDKALLRCSLSHDSPLEGNMTLEKIIPDEDHQSWHFLPLEKSDGYYTYFFRTSPNTIDGYIFAEKTPEELKKDYYVCRYTEEFPNMVKIARESQSMWWAYDGFEEYLEDNED